MVPVLKPDRKEVWYCADLRKLNPALKMGKVCRTHNRGNHAMAKRVLSVHIIRCHQWIFLDSTARRQSQINYFDHSLRDVCLLLTPIWITSVPEILQQKMSQRMQEIRDHTATRLHLHIVRRFIQSCWTAYE